jgi:hypothetical protein
MKTPMKSSDGYSDRRPIEDSLSVTYLAADYWSDRSWHKEDGATPSRSWEARCREDLLRAGRVVVSAHVSFAK